MENDRHCYSEAPIFHQLISRGLRRRIGQIAVDVKAEVAVGKSHTEKPRRTVEKEYKLLGKSWGGIKEHCQQPSTMEYMCVSMLRPT